MENTAYVELIAENLRLVNIAGNAVQHEKIDIGLESPGLDHCRNLRRPETDCDVIRDKLAFARVLQECFSVLGANVDGTKHIAASQMKKTRNRSDNFALGAFAGTGRA